MHHRVPFYETDAMGIVHHSNTVRTMEIARVAWLEEHDQPYTAYIESGHHFATTRVEVDYLRAVRFDDVVEVTVWLDWVRHASLQMAYELCVDGLPVATGATEHAAVDTDGRAVRMPRDRRDAMRKLAVRRGP